MTKSKKVKITPILADIKRDLQAGKMSLENIAEKHDYHLPNLKRDFKAQTHQTPAQYQKEHWDKLTKLPKIFQNAQKKLRAGFSIHAIIKNIPGYNTSSAFSRAFTLATTQTPEKYKTTEWNKNGGDGAFTSLKKHLAGKNGLTRIIKNACQTYGYSNAKQLNKAFSLATGGRGLRTFRKLKHLEKAKELIETTNYTPKKIAQELGYQALKESTAAQVLSHAFKDNYGVSITDYRKNLLQGQKKLPNPLTKRRHPSPPEL